MNHLLIPALAFAWLAILAGGWLGWQLLRQNGRVLSRLDELEKRLNELEFGEGEGPAGLPVGSEAPAFELPDLAGERKSLAEYPGQPLLLIFFNPACGFCQELAPKLAAVAAGFQPAVEGSILLPGEINSPNEEHPVLHDASAADTASAGLEAWRNGRQGCLPLRVLVISTGDAEANRQFFAEQKIGCPVLLQKQSEMATVYQVNGTPSGYLIDREGKIASELARGAEALLKLASQPVQGPPLTPALSPSEGERETSGGDGRADRFSQRSVARSKIKRDGLKAGTQSPDFRLPRLDGRGDFTLSELRGKRVLLVFSDPHCGPCNALAPTLEKFHRRCLAAADVANGQVGRGTPCAPQGDADFQNGAHGVTRPTVVVVMISRGEPKENRAKVKEHGLTFPVVLQQQWEISRRYAMFATPVACLIDEAGIIAHDVAVGTDAILELLARAGRVFEGARGLTPT